MRNLVISVLLVLILSTFVGAQDMTLVSFDKMPSNIKFGGSVGQLDKVDGRNVLTVDYERIDWPNITFTLPEKGLDWSAYGGIVFDVYNPGPRSFTVSMRIDNADRNAAQSFTAFPRQWTTCKFFFESDDNKVFWGMRGVPIRGAIGTLPMPIDLTKIVAFQVYLPLPQDAYKLCVGEIKLFAKEAPLSKLVPMPFVDKFGQYKHADWLGKLKSEEELKQRRADEEKYFESWKRAPSLDRFGGWADGPKLKATGWFRTEKVDGRWWLVDPEGRVFFSTGIDCVGPGEHGLIEKRQAWHEWLPSSRGIFGECYGYGSGATMAEAVDGKGKIFSFYRANLIRKFGTNWFEPWIDMAQRRLQNWGFNTIGNWSDGTLLSKSTMPFVASVGLDGNFYRMEKGAIAPSGLPDPYDPNFAKVVEAKARLLGELYGKNPLCVGFFVDNEMSWLEPYDLIPKLIAAPADSPSKSELFKMLRAKYPDIAALNAAWGTNNQSWNDLKTGKTDVCKQDLYDFTFQHAQRYYTIVRDELRKYVPNHLYLGSRFSVHPDAAVKACASVVDVVSYNMYYDAINSDKFTGENDLGKPIIIGEFHFGALDTGMFHCGLVSAKDQNDRARKYITYLESVADSPAFVGCHWFQYVNSPITGRWFDGENYNIGFVDVTDTPYPELSAAAKKINHEVYERHIRSK